jgi:hypothetical protein
MQLNLPFGFGAIKQEPANRLGWFMEGKGWPAPLLKKMEKKRD